MTAELPDFMLDDEPAEAPIVHRRGGPRAGGDADDAARAEDPADEDDSPVAFRRGQPVTSPDPDPEEKRDAE